MGIRQAIQENTRIGVVALVVLLALAGVMIVYQAGNLRGPRVVVPEYFFTTDDGKTLFSASAALIPPFDHDGKPAVRAYVFKCSDKQFVGYLERYTEQTRKLLLQADEAAKNATPGQEAPPIIAQAGGAARAGREVKRPGDAKWVPAYSGEGTKITDVQPPPGITGDLEPVTP